MGQVLDLLIEGTVNAIPYVHRGNDFGPLIVEPIDGISVGASMLPWFEINSVRRQVIGARIIIVSMKIVHHLNPCSALRQKVPSSGSGNRDERI